MVINEKKRFIFIHVPKAAGTSVMKTLELIPSNNTRWLAKTKHETLCEFYVNFSERLSFIDRLFSKSPKDYFTFAFVRNPWDRMSSFYRYLVEKRPKSEIDSVENFKDFLIQAEDGVGWIQSLHSMKSQLDYFTLADGVMKIDFLGHYEYLVEDFSTVAELISAPDLSLEHQNRSTNSGVDYRDFYDSEMLDLVAKRFEDEIRLFGYDFDSKYPKKRFSKSLSCSR